MGGQVNRVAVAGVSLALAVHSAGGVSAGLTLAALLALACSFAVDWVAPAGRASPVSVVPAALFAAAALAVAPARPFLPLIAHACAQCPPAESGVDAPTPTRGRVASAVLRWIWMAPAALTLVGVGALGLGDAASAVPPDAAGRIAVALTCGVAFLLGSLQADHARLQRRLGRLQDMRREETRRARRQLADAEEERAGAARIAVLTERTRIAREIHDSVGHLLTRAIMQARASAAVAGASGDQRGAAALDAVRETLDQAMTTVRRSVHDLEDSGTDFAARMEAAAGSLRVDQGAPGKPGTPAVQLSNGVREAPAPVARCFAAAIREALSNTARHSAAQTVHITVRDLPALWQLVVQDDGGARPAGAARDPRGMGIADIEDRVRALGGTTSIGPHGPGWRVFAAIPKKGFEQEGPA